MKFCKDCKHFFTPPGYCRRLIVNMVTGEVLPLGGNTKIGTPDMFAGYQRDDHNLCGAQARFWEYRDA